MKALDFGLDTKTEQVLATSIQEISEVHHFLRAACHDLPQKLAQMLERHLLVRHDLGQVLQKLASSDYEALLQLIGLQIEVLLCKVEPRLDESEVEEGLLGRLNDPLLLLVEVL